jgi:predicted GNAT family acetyltransferase
VGCLLVHEANGCIGIELVSTLPEFRGKGIATSLVLHAIRNRSKGIGTVWLIATRGGNAERLYSKIGFKTIGFVESERMT